MGGGAFFRNFRVFTRIVPCAKFENSNFIDKKSKKSMFWLAPPPNYYFCFISEISFSLRIKTVYAIFALSSIWAHSWDVLGVTGVYP